VRADIVAELREHKDHYVETNVVEGDYDSHVNQMAKPGIWGGQAELQAAANVYRRTIYLLGDGFRNPVVVPPSIERKEPEGVEGSDLIVLVYPNRDHYQATKPNPSLFAELKKKESTSLASFGELEMPLSSILDHADIRNDAKREAQIKARLREFEIAADDDRLFIKITQLIQRWSSLESKAGSVTKEIKPLILAHQWGAQELRRRSPTEGGEHIIDTSLLEHFEKEQEKLVSKLESATNATETPWQELRTWSEKEQKALQNYLFRCAQLEASLKPKGK